MVTNTTFYHIGEVIEFLRGKTIVKSLSIRHIGGREETQSLGFSFLDYVNWSYGGKFKPALDDYKSVSEVEITACQLFSEDKNFTIRFRRESVYFEMVQNVEDTLLLDLTRYLESNQIPYGVSANGIN